MPEDVRRFNFYSRQIQEQIKVILDLYILFRAL